MELIKMYGELGISEKVLNYGREIEKSLHDRFEAIDKTAEYNQLKVIKAMQEARVSDIHFAGTTGYGYNDLGRDTLEEVYAKAFHGEDALVRPQLISGTHALTIALSGNLRPGDEILSPVGKPYDTLEEVIGIRDSVGSLKEFGITYSQVDLLPNGDFDFENIKKAINERTKLIEIQRSKGYATRPTLSVKRIGELISFIKSIKPDVICMVDNCYGEFVEEMEHLGMIVDVSHLSDAGFWDVIRYTKKPFVASHSNARALVPDCPRDLTDDMIRALSERGGVAGINYFPPFLSAQDPKADRSAYQSRISDMIRHMKHMKQVGGIQCIGLGSDFDGIHGDLEMKDGSELPKLEWAMRKEGFTESEIEAVFYGNVLRVYKEVL